MKNTLGSESSCSSSSSTDAHRKKEYGKKDRKIVRILTVVAYVVCVSMAAVLLSTYYVFLWSPDMKSSVTESPKTSKYTQSNPTLNTNYNGNKPKTGHGPHYVSKFVPSFAPSASQPSVRYAMKQNFQYINANTKAYHLRQIPTPQPLLMMTKILTTVDDGGTTSTSTTTTPSPPVKKHDLNAYPQTL